MTIDGTQRTAKHAQRRSEPQQPGGRTATAPASSIDCCGPPQRPSLSMLAVAKKTTLETRAKTLRCEFHKTITKILKLCGGGTKSRLRVPLISAYTDGGSSRRLDRLKNSK